MPAHARHRDLPPLRLLALVLLALWLLAKPVLAASCELDDMRLAQGSAQCVLAADSDPGDECCTGKLCGECCTAGTVLPTAPARALPIPAAIRPHAALSVTTDPAALPVAIRPPIAA